MNPPPPIMHIEIGVIGFLSRFTRSMKLCSEREEKENAEEEEEREKKVCVEVS